MTKIENLDIDRTPGEIVSEINQIREDIVENPPSNELVDTSKLTEIEETVEEWGYIECALAVLATESVTEPLQEIHERDIAYGDNWEEITQGLAKEYITHYLQEEPLTELETPETPSAIDPNVVEENTEKAANKALKKTEDSDMEIWSAVYEVIPTRENIIEDAVYLTQIEEIYDEDGTNSIESNQLETTAKEDNPARLIYSELAYFGIVNILQKELDIE